MKHQEEITVLFRKYFANQCSPEETIELIDIIQSGENSELVQSLLEQTLNQEAVADLVYKAQTGKIFAKLDLSTNGYQYHQIQTRNKKLYLKIAAAVIVILSGVATFYFFKPAPVQRFAVVNTVQDVSPGGNIATLVLSDGQQVELADRQVGSIAEDAGAIISKSADGQVAYQISGSNKLKGYNTVKTPRGGQYQVILPDGSKVWLNAASSVTYPAVFNEAERRVILTGEGYFEVNTIVRNNKKVPFIVETGKQKIEVLGTRFNVNAYDDETGIKTTLIEGKVKVVTDNETVILKPSQEFNLRAEGISTKRVDVEPSIDWKNGDFIFADENIKSIMRKIARWYNVELVYDSDIPGEKLSGQISRSRNLSEVLRMLELSGDMQFKIENGAVHISTQKK